MSNNISMTTITYTLDDYIRIKEINNPYDLPSSAIDIINYVSNMVGSPNYVKTPQFLMSDAKKKKRNKNSDLSTDDWEAIRNFQTTTKNEKVGIEKTIDNIKCEINKIADKNYNTQKDIIMELIREYILIYNKEELDKIGNLIIDVSSGNRFFSKLYSNLVIEILKTYDFITPIIDSNCNALKNSISDISKENINFDNDYEELCLKNKINELRRSKCVFFVNLMKQNFIEENFITSIIDIILNQLYKNFDFIEFTQANEELSELLYLIIEEGHEQFKCNPIWNHIYTKIENISKMKSNDKGLTNKTIFKIMDLLDIINTT